MDILFINYSPVGPNFSSSIASLSGYLKSYKQNVNIISFQDGTLADNKICEEISQIKPNIIAFSIYTSWWESIKKYIKLAKLTSPESLIVCGGYHSRLCPDDVISFEYVDIVCIGEGEIPLLKLAKAIENKKQYLDIEGLWVKKQDGNKPSIYKNKINPPIDLDIIPDWDRTLFFENNFGSAEYLPTYQGSIPISSGRGCSFNCTFCNNASVKNIYRNNQYYNYVRKRDINKIINECNYLINKFNAEFFEFWDEEFAYNKEWLYEFCDCYKRNIAKPFCCALRIELANEKTLKNLHNAGCVSISYGVESGNEMYRKKYLKRNMTNNQIIDAFEIAKCYKISRFAFVMIGLPYETQELIYETIDFLRKLKPEAVNWSVFQPLPKTELYEMCKKNNFFSNIELIPYNTFPKYKVKLIKQPSISVQQLEKCIKLLKSLKQIGININWD